MAEKQLDQELTQTEQRQSRLKELIAKGKEQGYLTYAEVNDHLPEEIADPDQVEDIIRMIGDMGIAVGEEAPDDDQLILGENSAATDDSAAEEAAAALAAVENDVGRTTDPVRMYMREMGTVELLTREGEIVIAKRIEEGIREVMQAMAYYPGIVDTVLAIYDRIQTEEGRMSDLLAGFLDLDPEDETPIEAASTEEVSDQNFDDSDSSNDDNDSNEDLVAFSDMVLPKCNDGCKLIQTTWGIKNPLYKKRDTYSRITLDEDTKHWYGNDTLDIIYFTLTNNNWV